MPNTAAFKKYQTTLVIAVIIGLSLLAGMFIASERLETFELSARVQVSDQKTVLNTIAETIARNGADSVTEAIIRDCPVAERLRFDLLLGQLDQQLGSTELRELEQLFSSCASFFADRKALMVARFTREIEVYEGQVNLLDTLTTSNEFDAFQVEQWQELVAYEQTQSDLFTTLVIAQKQIIDALIAGQSASSPPVVEILTGVQETREALVFARAKAAETRASLTSL